MQRITFIECRYSDTPERRETREVHIREIRTLSKSFFANALQQRQIREANGSKRRLFECNHFHATSTHVGHAL